MNGCYRIIDKDGFIQINEDCKEVRHAYLEDASNSFLPFNYT